MFEPDENEEHLDRLFHALAHQVRRDMLRRLALEELNISELAEHYDMSLPAVSKHARVLEDAELVTITKTGRVRRMQMQVKRLDTALEHIAEYKKYWEGRLDAIEAFIESTKDEEGK